MCDHNLKKISDVKICIKCGLTFPIGGKPFFDKELLRYLKGGRKKS